MGDMMPRNHFITAPELRFAVQYAAHEGWRRESLRSWVTPAGDRIRWSYMDGSAFQPIENATVYVVGGFSRYERGKFAYDVLKTRSNVVIKLVQYPMKDSD